MSYTNRPKPVVLPTKRPEGAEILWEIMRSDDQPDMEMQTVIERQPNFRDLRWDLHHALTRKLPYSLTIFDEITGRTFVWQNRAYRRGLQ